MQQAPAVIDADSHVTEPPDLWTSRLSSSRWGDLIPSVVADPTTGAEYWHLGGRRLVGVAKSAPAGWGDFPPDHPPTLAEADPAAWDPAQRLERLTEYGIDVQLLYPNLLGFHSVFFMDLEPALRLEVVRAYNDFLTDFCSEDPRRLIALMWLPFWDVDAAVAEMERCAALGHRGIVFPSNFEPVGLPPVFDEHWYPVWAAAQDMELPVNFHVAVGMGLDEYRKDLKGAGPAQYAKSSALFIVGNQRTVADITLFGVCHRFPRLDFVSVESGCGWMPYFAQLLDWQWLASGCRQTYPDMDLLPSEYIRRQVYGTFWFESIPPGSLGPFEDNFMFSSDFPHPTSLSPGPASYADNPADAIEKNLAGIAPDVVAKLLHGNAARVYRLGS